METTHQAAPRVGRILFCAAVGLACLACLDVLSCAFTDRGIQGMDCWVLVPAVGFLFCAALARSLAQRLSIGLVACVACLLLMEGLLSVAHFDAKRPHPWYVWPPNYACRVVPGDLPGVTDEGRFSTNSLGMRGDEPPAEATYRILCLGGSTTECFYLDDRKAWPHVLQEQLRQHDSGVWVANVGRAGLMSTDHLAALENLPEARQFDCWVVLCGVNDLCSQLSSQYEQTAREAFERTFVWRRPGLLGSWDRPFLRNTYTFTVSRATIRRLKVWWKSGGVEVLQDRRAAWLGGARKARFEGPKTDVLPDLTAALDVYEQNLRRLFALSRQQGKRLLLLTQPTLWQEGLAPELEALCWYGFSPDGKYYTVGALARGMEQYNERLRQVCRNEDIECVDLAASVPKSTLAFYDHCHLNDAGSDQVARQVAAEMQRSAQRAAATATQVGPSFR